MLIEILKKLFYPGCIWLNKIVTFRSSHQRCSTATLLKKKRLWYRYFPVNFVKFLKTLFLQNASSRLLLYLLKKILTLHSVKVSSSPNSPLLFVIVFSGETNRSTLLQMKFLLATILKRDSNTGVFLGNLRNF